MLLIYESKGLLVGEGVDAAELRKLRALLQAEEGVETVRKIVTMHFGPQTVLLATELRFRPQLKVQEMASIAAALKEKIRAGRPEIKHILLPSTRTTNDGSVSLPTPRPVQGSCRKLWRVGLTHFFI